VKNEWLRGDQIGELIRKVDISEQTLLWVDVERVGDRSDTATETAGGLHSELMQDKNSRCGAKRLLGRQSPFVVEAASEFFNRSIQNLAACAQRTCLRNGMLIPPFDGQIRNQGNLRQTGKDVFRAENRLDLEIFQRS
jgi:hypothetical protein